MQNAVVLSAGNVRGLAHPLRVEILGWLREHGPVTATGMAAAISQSSGTTSYHLRRLAHFGFIVDAPDLGKGRERWWQAAHATTTSYLAGERETDAATSDWRLKLTTTQSRHLIEELDSVVAGYREARGVHSGDAPASVVVQIQVLPGAQPHT